MTSSMTFDQLTERYVRLRNELAAAYGLVPWDTGHIDWLTNDLATTELELAAATAGHLRVVEMPSAHTGSPLLRSR